MRVFAGGRGAGSGAILTCRDAGFCRARRETGSNAAMRVCALTHLKSTCQVDAMLLLYCAKVNTVKDCIEESYLMEFEQTGLRKFAWSAGEQYWVAISKSVLLVSGFGS